MSTQNKVRLGFIGAGLVGHQQPYTRFLPPATTSN